MGGRPGGLANGCSREEGDNNGFNDDDDDSWERPLVDWGWEMCIRLCGLDDGTNPGNRRCWSFLEAILPACSTRLWAVEVRQQEWG